MAQFLGKATVTINCGTSGSSIKYTLDGTNPSASVGTSYSSPFTQYKNATVKAIATKSGLIDSEIASSEITVKLPSLEGLFEVQNNGDSAKITKTGAYLTSLYGEDVYGSVFFKYTTDGTDPTSESSTLPTQGLTLDSNKTVKIKAISENNVDSDILTLTVSTLKVKTPVISVA